MRHCKGFVGSWLIGSHERYDIDDFVAVHYHSFYSRIKTNTPLSSLIKIWDQFHFQHNASQSPKKNNNNTLKRKLKTNNYHDNGKCQCCIYTCLHGREVHFHARPQAHPCSRLPHLPPPTHRRSRQALPLRRRLSLRRLILRPQHVRPNAPSIHLLLQHTHPCPFPLHYPFPLLPILQHHEAKQCRS